MATKHPMTTNGIKAMEAELAKLIRIDREEIKTLIAEAREHGDLKENAEYHSAKEKQSMIEGRIADLQSKVASAQVIDVSKLNHDKVVFGATVTLLHIEKEEIVTYQIVGEDEAKSNKGQISYSSPLAKALIGKEEGDEIIVKAPKGDIHYEIQEVQYK